MYLVHKPTGFAVFLAKSFAGWYSPESAKSHDAMNELFGVNEVSMAAPESFVIAFDHGKPEAIDVNRVDGYEHLRKVTLSNDA